MSTPPIRSFDPPLLLPFAEWRHRNFEPCGARRVCSRNQAEIAEISTQI